MATVTEINPDVKSQSPNLSAKVTGLLLLIRTYRELLGEAIEMVRHLEGTVRAVRGQNRALRAELRAMFSGRTIAEERQAEPEVEA